MTFKGTRMRMDYGYRSLALFAVALLLTTASSCTRRQAYQGVYEGIRMQKKIEADPSEKAGKEDDDLTYGQYEDRRREMMEQPQPLLQQD